MAKSTRPLHTYRSKRDFTKTAEPSGSAPVQAAEHSRFVIQKHAARRLHYDLRLELDGVFKSWAVTKGPSLDPAVKRLAVEVEDHPLDYGDFEGTIPHGEYGGGTVQLWDRGFWAPEGAKTPQAALKDGDLKFVLAGERLQGSWVLVRIKSNRGRDTHKNWLLIKHNDEYAKPAAADDVLAEDRSVASARTMAQIERGVGKRPAPFMLASARAQKADAVWHSNRTRLEPAVVTAPAPAKPTAKTARKAPPTRTAGSVKSLPEFIEPQLCKLVDRPPGDASWAHEVKFDGYRVQLRVDNRQVTIRTRSGLDWTEKFPHIAQAMRSLPDCIVDGEIVALDANRMPSFAALQAALSDRETGQLVLFAFDLLIQGRRDLRPLPLHERKARLKELLAAANLENHVRYVEHFESGATAVLQSACQMHLEGIVSKQLEAPYRSGRSGYWTKAKCRAGHEIVIGGWTTEGGSLRSLLAGVNKDRHLVYIGRIGTGYGAGVKSKLLPQLKQLTTDESPFSGENAPRKERNVRWLKPQLVAEIEFAGWTATGMIRQAAFKGLRSDKAAADVVAERAAPLADNGLDPEEALAASVRTKPSTRSTSAPRPGKRQATPRKPGSGGAAVIMGVPLSKPDKELWPDAGDGKPVTKLDLASYFEAVGAWMLPHLSGRPCSLLRAPDGIKGQHFFQRHAMAGMSNLFSHVKVRGDKAPYVQIDRVEALAAVAQMGALELHPWNCAIGNPEVAGRLVFDLDPAPDVSFEAVIDAAIEMRQRLKGVGLESFCKTTGGKGLHVVTPLTAGKDAVPWPDAKNFAHMICAQMSSDAPTKYLDTMSKALRKGRIFLDYLRNDRTSTAVAVLSPRAREGAPVSMPIHWKDVRTGLDPHRYTVHSTPSVLAKSKPWSDYDAAARPLDAAIKRVVTNNSKQVRTRRRPASARSRPAAAR